MPESRRRALLIVNGRRPLSRGVAMRFAGLALARSIDLEIVHTSLVDERPDSEALGHRAGTGGFDLALVAGGDGTISEVVAGLERARIERVAARLGGRPFASLDELRAIDGLDRRVELFLEHVAAEASLGEPPPAPALGVLPYGSANVLAMNLGLSRSLEKAFWELLTEGRHRVEAMKTAWLFTNAREPGSSVPFDHSFVIAAGAGGTVEELMEHFNRPGSRRRGFRGYVASGWHVFRNHRPRTIEARMETLELPPRAMNFLLINLRPRMVWGKVVMPRADDPRLHAVVSWARPGSRQFGMLLRLLQRIGLGRIVHRDRLTDYHRIHRAEIRFHEARVTFQFDGEVRTLATDDPPLRGIFLALPDRVRTIRSTARRGALRYLWSLFSPFREEIVPPSDSRPTLHRFVLPFFGRRDDDGRDGREG